MTYAGKMDVRSRGRPDDEGPHMDIAQDSCQGRNDDNNTVLVFRSDYKSLPHPFP